MSLRQSMIYGLLATFLLQGVNVCGVDKPLASVVQVNKPLQEGVLDDPLASMFLDYCTYGAAETVMPYSQMQKFGAGDCSADVAQTIRKALRDYGIANADELRIYRMNRLARQTTEFPGVLVTNGCVFIDENLFKHNLSAPEQHALCCYAAVLLEQHFYFKDKASSVTSRLAVQMIVTSLLPYVTTALAAGATFTGLQTAGQSVAAYVPGLVCSGASLISYYVLLGYISGYVAPAVTKPADLFVTRCIAAIDKTVQERVGAATIALLNTFKKHMSSKDNDKIFRQEKFQQRIAVLSSSLAY